MSEENKVPEKDDIPEIKLSAPVKAPEIQEEAAPVQEETELKLKAPAVVPVAVAVPVKKRETKKSSGQSDEPKSYNRRRGCFILLVILLLIGGVGTYFTHRHWLVVRQYLDRFERFMSFHWVNKGELETTDLSVLNRQDAVGRSEFHFAARYGDILKMEKLFEAEADSQLLDRDKNNLLHYAAESGGGEAMEFLLKKKVLKINSVNADGETPLHIAARYNQLDTVKILLKYGASRTITDKNGKIPMELTDNGNIGNWLIPPGGIKVDAVKK